MSFLTLLAAFFCLIGILYCFYLLWRGALWLLDILWEYSIRHHRMKKELLEYRSTYGNIYPKCMTDEYLKDKKQK